jgi:hypothetical protein
MVRQCPAAVVREVAPEVDIEVQVEVTIGADTREMKEVGIKAGIGEIEVVTVVDREEVELGDKVAVSEELSFGGGVVA